MFPHYVLVAFPVPFLLIGALLGRWTRDGRIWKRALLALGLMLITGSHLLFLGSWFGYVRDGGPRGDGHYELSYRQRRLAVESILRDSPDRLVGLAGPFAQKEGELGQCPAYLLAYHHELGRLGRQKLPQDELCRYWIDEGPDESLDLPAGWIVEKYWRVGPSRIFRLRRAADRS